jgi:hypothetical protein
MSNIEIEEGVSFRRREQRYTITDDSIPYVCAAGREIALVGLISRCAECRKPFALVATRSRVLGTHRGGYLTRRCVKHRNPGRVRRPRKRFSQRQRATIERIIRALAAERPRRWHSASCIAEQLGVSSATVSSTLADAFKVRARRWLSGKGGLVRRKHRNRWLYSFTPTRSARVPRLEVQMIRRDNCAMARTPCREARAALGL